MPQRFKHVLFVLVGGELLSVFAMVVLALIGSPHVLLGVNAFGAFLAARALLVVLGAILWGEIFSHPRPLLRTQKQSLFWFRATLNFFLAMFGIFLTQVPIR